MKTILLLTLLITLASHAEPKAAAVKHVDAKAAAALVQEKKATVLDVRTAGEFAEGHIAGAKNLDFNGADFEQRLKELDKTQPYLVHCRSGGRSGKSLATFQKLGFTNIHHLDGGIMAWEDAKQPLQK
jgi:phage shock protein E